MARVDSNIHQRSKASSSGFPDPEHRLETTLEPRNSLLAFQWAQIKRLKSPSHLLLRQVAPTRSRFVASRDASLSLFPQDANHSFLRRSLSDARYTFAGPTLTELPRNVLQKSFQSASARRALTRHAGDRPAQSQLQRTSNRRTSGNTLSIGNTSTNVSTTGLLDPDLWSAGIWSGRNQRPLLSPKKYPSPKTLLERSKAKRRTKLALDLLVREPRSALSPLRRPNGRENLSHLNTRITLRLRLPPRRHRTTLRLAQPLHYQASPLSLSNGNQMTMRSRCTKKTRKEKWM